MANQQHNIEKISVNVNTTSTHTGNLYKDNLPKLINSAFLNEADKLFSSICSENENVIIKELNIELDVQNETDFFDLRHQLTVQLKEKIQDATALRKQVIKDEFLTNQKFSKVENYSLVEGYLYFLKTGLKPWWLSTEKLNAILNGDWEKVFKTSENFTTLAEKIEGDQGVKGRFIKQQSKPLKMFYYINGKKVTSQVENQWEIWKVSFDQLPFIIVSLAKEKLISLVFQIIANKKGVTILKKELSVIFKSILKKWIEIRSKKDIQNVKEQFVSWAEKTLRFVNALLYENNEKPLQVSFEKILGEPYKGAINDEEKKTEVLEEIPSVYLDHAGLIIVYPFIKAMFKTCNLLTNTEDIISKDIAVHLLYYVATKRLKPYEHELALEKLLCGIPIQTPIEKEVELTKTHMQEAEEMLNAVSEHWKAVKSSSPDAIRNTFLIREGKLETDDFEKKLVIQRKTEDILIDKLPWSISIVKTPWMKHFITVEW